VKAVQVMMDGDEMDVVAATAVEMLQACHQ